MPTFETMATANPSPVTAMSPTSSYCGVVDDVLQTSSTLTSFYCTRVRVSPSAQPSRRLSDRLSRGARRTATGIAAIAMTAVVAATASAPADATSGAQPEDFERVMAACIIKGKANCASEPKRVPAGTPKPAVRLIYSHPKLNRGDDKLVPLLLEWMALQKLVERAEVYPEFWSAVETEQGHLQAQIDQQLPDQRSRDRMADLIEDDEFCDWLRAYFNRHADAVLAAMAMNPQRYSEVRHEAVTASRRLDRSRCGMRQAPRPARRVRPMARRRGAGRPRAQSTRSSVRSGDSGNDDPGEPSCSAGTRHQRWSA